MLHFSKNLQLQILFVYFTLHFTLYRPSTKFE